MTKKIRLSLYESSMQNKVRMEWRRLAMCGQIGNFQPSLWRVPMKAIMRSY